MENPFEGFDLDRSSRIPERWEAWVYFAIGAVAAPVFAWFSLSGWMGWFLATLMHEMGHSAFAWFLGMPSIPAISLAGEAAAVHGSQILPLVLAIWIGLGFGAWFLRPAAMRYTVMVAVVVTYPFLAWTDMREILHLLGGHLGELIFAVIFFWRALVGGFTSNRIERVLYAMLAWYLVGRNVLLCIGLVTSPAARSEYQMNGSFGLVNDYIRIGDILGWGVEGVALLMLLPALLVLPLAIIPPILISAQLSSSQETALPSSAL